MNNKQKHFWIYVLELEQGKLYVGQTSRKNPMDRINEHLGGFYTAQWVRKYKPTGNYQLIDIGTASLDQAGEIELEKTRELMRKYGHNTVRGGSLNYSGKYIKIGRNLYGEHYIQGLAGLFIMTLSLLATAILAWE